MDVDGWGWMDVDGWMNGRKGGRMDEPTGKDPDTLPDLPGLQMSSAPIKPAL